MAKGDTWNNSLFGFGKAPGYFPHYSPYFEFVKSNFHKQNQIFKSCICHRLSSKWAWILIYFNAMPANFQTNVTYDTFILAGMQCLVWTNVGRIFRYKWISASFCKSFECTKFPLQTVYVAQELEGVPFISSSFSGLKGYSEHFHELLGHGIDGRKSQHPFELTLGVVNDCRYGLLWSSLPWTNARSPWLSQPLVQVRVWQVRLLWYHFPA